MLQTPTGSHFCNVALPGPVHCVRLIKSQLWVCHDGGIDAYDQGLRHLRSIINTEAVGGEGEDRRGEGGGGGGGEMGIVRDVAESTAGCDEVFVAAERGLYAMGATGEW